MKIRYLSIVGMCLVAACGVGGASSSGDAGAGGSAGSAGSSGTAGGGGTGGGSSACDPPLPTFADGKKPTSTLYIMAGAPAGGDGSQGKPFGTLNDALKVVSPGTEVRVSGELTGLTYTTGVKGTEA